MDLHSLFAQSKLATRGEAAWASGRGEETILDEDEQAMLDAREANRCALYQILQLRQSKTTTS
jgi:hypothetical protein